MPTTTPKTRVRNKRRLAAACKAEHLKLTGMNARSKNVGTRCREQLAIYQKAHKLTVTERFDDRTLDHLFPGRARRRFRLAMVTGYRTLRDVKEVPIGSNWGPMVKKILAHVGFTSPAAWCCATVWYVADLFAHYDGPRQTGSRAFVPDLEEWAKTKGIIVPLRKSRPGMVVTYCWDGVRRVGQGDHVGVLLAPAWGVAIVRTGGGNEQDRVKISVHSVSQINCVIDLARLQRV